MAISYRSGLLGRAVTSLCGLALVVACGGGGDIVSTASNSVVVSGTAATGAPLVGAAVTAKCQFNTTANGITQANGLYTLDVLASVLPCAIRVVPAGGGQALYSMATGTKSPLTVNVTPLTSLAVSLAVKESIGQTTEAWFDAGNSLGSVSGALAGAQTKLAAALTAAGYSIPTPFDPVTAAFSAKTGDKYDDLLEAVAAGIKASGGSFASAQTSFVAGGGAALPKPAVVTGGTGAAGTTTASTTTPGTTTSSGTSTSARATATATLNPLLAKSYNLAFYPGTIGCGTVCSFIDKQALTVVVGAGGTLEIAGKQLANPYLRVLNGSPHIPEIIWRDGDIEYALTNNSTGVFSEINVGDLSKLNHNNFPTHLGQIRAVEVEGIAAISQYAGTYTKSTQYYGPTTTWTGLTIAADGAISFTGGAGPSLNVSGVSSTQDFNGCCGKVSVFAKTDLNNDSKIDQYDTISLFRKADGQLESIEYYRTSSVLVGVLLGTPTPLPAQGSTAMPAANNVSFKAGTTTISMPNVLNSGGQSQSSGGGFNLFASTGAGGTDNTVQLAMQSPVAFAINTPYVCRNNQEPNVKTNVTMFSRIRNDFYYSNEGGRCEVILTQITLDAKNQITSAQGRIVADLRTFKRDAPALVISDLVFHYVKP